MEVTKFTQKIIMPEGQEQQQSAIAAAIAETLSSNGGKVSRFQVERIDDQFKGQAYLHVWIEQIPSPVSFEEFCQLTASQISCVVWQFSKQEGNFLYRAFTGNRGGAIIRYKNPDVASYDCAGCGISQFGTVLDKVRGKLSPTDRP